MADISARVQMNTMKGPDFILMVTNVYFPVIGGISTYVRDLAEGLEQTGRQVKILAFPQMFNSIPRMLRWFFYGFFIFRALLAVGLLRLQGIRPVVHSHSASFCMVAAVACKMLLRCQAVHTFHSPLDHRSWVLRKFTPFLVQVVYVSRATRDLYRKFDVQSHPNEFIIPGGVTVSRFPVPDLKKRFSTFPLHILFVGRICKEKGVREAIEAVGMMQHEVILEIVGVAQTREQEAYLDDLHKIVEGSKTLQRRVLFSGKLTGDALDQAYSRSSIFVCPSIWEEPAPMVIPEAMAVGIPVVAFDTGGLRERIDDGKDGLLVPKGDVTALAHTLDDLLEDSERLRRMGMAARSHAEKEFSSLLMVQRYIELYGKH